MSDPPNHKNVAEPLVRVYIVRAQQENIPLPSDCPYLMVTHCYDQQTSSQFAEFLYTTVTITKVHGQTEMQYGGTTAPYI